MQCLVCANPDTEVVLELSGVPTAVARLYWTEAAARAVPRGDIALRLCTSCSLVWNAAFEPECVVDLAGGYNASLSHSPMYRQFLERTADRLAVRYRLRDARVVEVGSGDGSFLRLLCGRPRCHGIGVDPSGPTGEEVVGDMRVTFLPELLADRHEALDASLVVSRQMFHNVADPVGFACQMGRVGAALYVEVPNATHVFGEGLAWSVYYEHASYFSAAALARTLEEAGMALTEVAACYVDEQYLYAEAAPSGGSIPAPQVDPRFLDHVRKFGHESRKTVNHWRQRLAESDGTVVVWGAAGRGTTFCNTADPGRRVRAVVDSNPARHGTFIAGTGQTVVAPDALADLQPDIVVLTNPTYEAEIRASIAQYSGAPEIVLA